MNSAKMFQLCILISLCLLVVATACSIAPAPSKPVVSIGSPPHGASVNLGQEVLVQAIAADSNGITRVELWVDGMLVTVSQPSSSQTTYSAVMHWLPTLAGSHMLMVKAINTLGMNSDPAAVTVTVVGQTLPTAPTAATAVLPPAATAVPTLPPTALATAAATQAAPTTAACQNNAEFVEHVTVPDGTNWMPGQAFNKIWRVRNTGTSAWGPGYEFVFVGGEAMTTQATFVVPVTAPGATADSLVAMIAPATAGSHSGQWRLREAKTGLFGSTMGVSINVLGSTQTQPLPSGCSGAPVIASFDANPATISAGQSTMLNWGKVDNANSAVIDQGIGGVPTPGNASVKPDKTTTYTLTAAGCGGTVTKQATVTVNPTLPGITGQVVPGPLQLRDLAVTKMYLVSTTGPSRLHVDVKNTGNVDFSGSFNYKCVVPQMLQRGTNQMVGALGDEGTINRSISKGGTDFFNPLGTMSFDATLYWYPQVICVVTLEGDPTTDDNSMVITIP